MFFQFSHFFNGWINFLQEYWHFIFLKDAFLGGFSHHHRRGNQRRMFFVLLTHMKCWNRIGFPVQSGAPVVDGDQFWVKVTTAKNGILRCFPLWTSVYKFLPIWQQVGVAFQWKVKNPDCFTLLVSLLWFFVSLRCW